MTQYMHVYGFKKRATSKMNRSTHTLSILMSMLRVWLEAGKKQLRSSLEAGKRQSGVRLVANEITARRQRGYGSSLTRLRLVIIMLLALMTFGINNVLAQSFEPGLYFIASRDYVPANTTTNFYLCPTESWYYYQSSDPYYTNSDNGMPFMTTYRCRDGVYDALNAIWSIERVGETNYYYIKHVSDGKYLTYNRKMADGNEGRMRMHLEASPSDNDAAQFQINWVAGTNCYEITTKKENSRKYLNPTGPSSGNGNINRLVGTNDRTDGPSGCKNVGGIIGLWTGGPSSDRNSMWYLEDASSYVCETPTITYNEATQEVSISTTTDGATIYYTTDGTEPTTSSTEYTDAFTVSATTNIQAIAVKTGMINSAVGSKKVVKYIYNIVDRSGTGNIAIKYIIPHPVTPGGALNGYDDIPEEIRSPYIYGEEIKFYNNADLADEHEISERPSTDNIYITYTTTHLIEKFLHLRGQRALNVTLGDGDNYIYDNGTTGFAHAGSLPSEGDASFNKYLWYFSGNDPYAVEIRNAATKNYVGYTTPSTLSLTGSPTNKKFILMSGSATDTGNPRTYEQLEFMAATGDGNYYRIGRTDDNFNISSTTAGHDASLQITATPTSSYATYNLVDQAGKILLTKSGPLEDVEIPAEWRSPLVDKYNYWKVGAFDTYDDGTTYKLKADPEPYRITTPTDVEDGNIYITYEVNNTVTFDISDDDETHPGLYPTYMLRFWSGEEFLQENGKDGLDAIAQKAEYPYSNGDAMLYVYSDAKRETQFASGASTRPRWLWYAVSPKAATVNNGVTDEPVTPGYKGDPYHVKIMSYSAQASSHNYFRTYVVNYGGSNHVVTGVTTKNENVDASHDNQLPTEYMVLSAPNNRYKLVTVKEIADGTTTERRTVNTFEQYWKNNPTIQNMLGESKVTTPESVDDDGIDISPWATQLPNNWHTYKAWANAAPWDSWSDGGGGSGKKYHNKYHWFQTIDMGNTGEFTFIAQSVEPEVILLDQHGWEIMRAPLSDAAALKKYDSPMVETYHWYPTAAKVTGYHKYKVNNPQIPVYYSYKDASNKEKWALTGDSITFTSTTLGENPYNHFKEYNPEYEDQPASVQTDFYVTYTVKPEFTSLYSGAATEDAVTPSAFLLRLRNREDGNLQYAKNVGNALSTVTTVPSNLEEVTEDLKWYVKPNFDIDEEMGYKYDVREADVNGDSLVLDKTQKEALNFKEGRNGFDPYNVQIQSVSGSTYYFKTATTGSQLNKGAWEGTSTDLSLQNLKREGTTQKADGYDQTTLSITNATFMVVIDSKGDTLLMPRFDNTKVVNSLSAPRLSAPNEATQSLRLTMVPTVVYSSSKLKALGGQYILGDGFVFESDFKSLGTSETPFTGSIDGRGNTVLSTLKVPMIAYAKDAILKNIILDNVSIGGGTNVGAFVANASGDTRIYNCGINSGSVAGTDSVGGIVGVLNGRARVINCYSYANITGGDNVGGIVGNNKVATTAAMIHEGNGTMVMNCMFYGDITGGTNKSPVYGGTLINNLQGGLNNFNYYAYEKLPTSHITNGKYNNALAVEDKFLNRFEYYRLLLNSNKKLAAFYATSEEETVKPSDMMKWVLETADRSIAVPKPYPVLKAQGYYPSIINYDVENAPDSASVGRNHGGKLGKTLSVTISSVQTSGGQTKPDGATITTSSLTLQRTDKDFDRFNFNYDKVQLPYYNDVGTGNYTENKVVTGWKITAITPVAGDPYTADNYPTTGVKDFPDHNYADRKSSNKDLYSVSKRVFSQGAYFDVPYGVTSITIEPYWANAIYVADANYDVVYKNDYSGKQGVSQTGTQAVDNTTTFNGQKVRTSITGLGSGTTVYDNAVVLVGNFHLDGVPSNGTTPFTMMSVDEDNDHEPDYSLIYHHKGRTAICPIRFDFLNVIGTAQAQKPNGASLICNFTIFKTKGWFEVTNTSSFYSSQLEYENLDGVSKSDAPLILLGGVVDQFVSTQSKAVTGKTIYIHVGGNVWIKEFGMGTHSDGSQSTPHVPVSVTGGEFPGFYLTGTYNANATVRKDNAECYISGGHFGEVAGASLEQIDGNVRWQIYNADIDEFFGGGINEAKPITGEVRTDIFNSHVTLFCGGPKFGNMQGDKKVITTAEGCTFGKFFGAGYGGTSIAKKKYYDKDGSQNWTTLQNYYATGDRGKYFDGQTTQSSQTPGKDYGRKGLGVATDFDYEFFVWSTGTTGARLFVNFASFSLAQCNDVESNLKGCTINDAFYGGGSLGKVVGKATSVLDGCTVHGNVFGGGFSATLPTIQVRDAGFATDHNPNYNSQSGMFEPGVFSGTTEFTWKNATEAGKTLTNGQSGSDLTNHYIYTNADLTALGQVKETDLTVKNNCLVEGGVYGGGDESAVNDNTLVKIENAGGSNKISNVYGGGNTADVDGNTEVHMMNGTVNHDIYGGGRGETTKVGGDVTVNIGEKDAETSALRGDGIVEGDVYGGSALGDVNTTVDKTTTVNVYGGTVNGSVFGGGLGQEHVAARDAVGSPGDPKYVPAQAEVPAIVAKNQGNTTVNVEGGLVKTAVYGGSNVNGVLKKDATVTLIGGTVGNAENQNRNVVFGGGFGAPTLVNGNVTVNVGKEGQTSAGAIIYGHVYGGGALGSTNGEWVTDDSTEPAITTFQPVAKTKTLVNLLKGTINGYAYGGGLGDAETAAYVGGDVTVTLDGAKVQQVFGANNINGTPKGHVLVHVKRTTGGSAKDPSKTREQRTPTDPAYVYDVEAVYGGGNMADYVPTKATGTPAEQEEAFAEVIIEGCQKTSIDKVYGGGNAAAVPATNVTVKGTYIINTLYGGGNGAGDGNLGANVGYKSYSSLTPTEEEKTSKQYGTGKAETKLLGGYINDVYGGSNTRGDVRGGTDVRTKKVDDVITGDFCSDLNVGHIYGAGSHADVQGDVNITLGCMPEDFVAAVYGGAEEATIEGDVTLTVTSGKFGRVFGGNNKGGDIQGSINVIVNEHGCKPLIIGELYGGGNAAPYSIYGCTKDDKGNWTAKTEGTDYTEGKDHAIEVEVLACTSIGKVFGGGMGATAKVIGNTRVYISMMKGFVDTDGNGVEEKQDTIGVIGKVFGGGGLADVIGNTLVDIGTADASEENGVNIISGQKYLNPETGALNENITAGVYGGGSEADVEGNTILNIGTKNLPLDVKIAGNIFGGGFGATTHVTGNVTVNIGTNESGTPVGYAIITGDVYGGSAKGTVNSTNNSEVNKYTPEDSETPEKCYTKVNFYGGEITGNIYGGGEGQREAAAVAEDVLYTAEDPEVIAGSKNVGDVKIPAHAAVPAIAADVYGPVTVTIEKGSTTNTIVDNVFGCNNYLGTPKDTVAVIINGGLINHSVYGGGNQAAYTPTVELAEEAKIYPAVYVNNVTEITENVFGGGLGLTAVVTGNPHITIGDNVKGHAVAIKKSVYGGGELAGVHGNTNIIVNKGTIGTEGKGSDVFGNVYGGGYGTDNTSKITEAQAVQEAGIVKGNTTVTINGGTILHNIYGGGANGSVGTFTYDANNFITGYTSGGLATVNILGGTVGTNGHENGMIFGSSRGDVGAPDAIQDKVAWVYDTQVTIGTSGHGTDAPEPQIKGSLYGGGENGHTFNDASVTIHSGRIGITDTSIDGGADYEFRGNVYGGGCGTDKYYADPAKETHDGNGTLYNITAGIVKGNATVTIDGGHVVRNVHGGGAMGSVTGGTTVNISGNTEIGYTGMPGGYVYAASRGNDDMEEGYATVGSTALNISGGTIWHSAFGGGQLGAVKGSVAVNVSGGVVKEDVYGGGALANTNTDNWTGDDGTPSYVVVTGLATETYRVKEMAIGASVTGLYTYDSGTSTYVAATGTADEGVVYYEKLTGAPVAGYYTKSGDVYTRITNSTATADGSTTYYKKMVKGSWVATPPVNSTSYYSTTVSLTGGLLSNAYGGGLGNSDVAANVYGDVTVTVNQGVEDETKGVAFIQQMETATIGGTPYPTPVPVSGRVFGGNNHNGTPTGNITVHVYSTRQLDKDDNILPGHGSPDRKYSYDIQSVYGGGNQADYLPADGKKSHVIIDGCNETSIEKVYGGGNSAVVPETDVLINGAYDIGYAFGGGNGDKPIKLDDGTWRENQGAIVIGLASIVCKGGKIGQVFGGGDAKGSCGNTNAVTKQDSDCPLHITRLYGAGNKGDVSSVNIVLAACSDKAIDYVHGGSYNAHVHGDVHLTITSGVLKNVYGGNDARGGIEGNIIVDIEETNGCKPIIIQNLVGGGNEAPYPGTKTNKEGVEVPIGTHGKITVNVKSATRIDNIYGGSYMAEADADTEVNINMIKGCKAGQSVTIPQEFSYIPNISDKSSPSNGVIACTIDDAIGTIGNVYGGGNLGLVNGKTTVNIGTSDHVEIMARDANGKILDVDNNPLDVEDGKNITATIKYNSITDATSHLGVNITGSVYGGGREADVTGNTYVNICAKETATPGTYAAVAEGSDKVTIAGNVYGGGKGIANSFTCEKAMVGIVDDGATVTGEDESATYTLKDGGTTVTIGHGTVGTLEAGKLVEGTGNVYGGGEIGRVERNTKVTIGIGNGTGETASPVIEGEVFGAGQGVATHGYSGLVRGNSTVTVQGDSWVKQSVYGAGKRASLGRYWIATTSADATAHNVEIGMPWGLKCGGQSTVTIQGHAKIGPEEAMTMPTFSGNVFGAGRGILPYEDTEEPYRYYIDNNGKYTREDYAGESKEGDYLKYVETLGVTNNSIVTIDGDAFIMGSVYGGSMNGSVFDGTVVNIAGGQIGRGKGKDAPHPADVWAPDYTPTSDLECPSWEYGKDTNSDGKKDLFAPYDKYANSSGKYPDGSSADEGRPEASDGHTFYGNVFGGGSGKDPYKAGKWHRKAGYVGGNTVVNITGGHILTSVYGGNELTDVGSGEDLKVVSGKGKCTINMTGGTLGVPRTEKQIAAHPVTCYLFGAGKGDQRIFFNKWTNVSETEVNITDDARIYGSVFGGGEDGHVLGDVTMNIGNVTIGSTSYTGGAVKIGTRGTSYVDGNVFGGGRGFSGEALTAGAVVGNVTMNISNGTMLGSIYGGGRLASVGTKLEDITDGEGNPNPKYGLISDDTDTEEFGHIAITISGGTIGNGTTEAGKTHSVSGNVFGGSMGRITLLDGTRNPVWPKLAVAKLTNVTISGGEIYNSVYGGGEYGVVRNRATVNVEGGTIHGNVFGGGYGSDEQDKQTIEVAGYAHTYYTFTPLIWTGCVSGDTFVNISGGSIKKNVYGGGNFASVGLIDFVSDASGKFTNMTKHESLTNGFGLSWPYEFHYHAAAPSDLPAVGGKEIGGKATVTIIGGKIGDASNAESGYVFGGGMGKPMERYTEAFMANVRETEVSIKYASTATALSDNNCITGAVYGGGENGHVYENSAVNITGGLIGYSVYGGGKGIDKYEATLKNWKDNGETTYKTDIYSITAGKVYGNTSVTMSGGHVMRNVYGGGYMASVGKGNYAGGADDYSDFTSEKFGHMSGYGETITGGNCGRRVWRSANW